jgi:hypothetical protein
MNRFPDFQTDLLFSETAPVEGADTAKSEAPAHAGGEHGETHVATTEQPVPLAPQATGVLEPISGMQTIVLVLFGLLAFCLLLCMTRYGRSHDYGD